MLLNCDSIAVLLRNGIVANSRDEYINGTSLDITLGPRVLVERARPLGDPARTIVLNKRQPLSMEEYTIGERGFILGPHDFCLAHSREEFNLPAWLSAEYKLKSSMARIGLEHLNAGWCDPGWNGSVLTMELVNITRHHNIVLHVGDRIGQMVFFRHEQVSDRRIYRGMYNGDKSATAPKGK